jgi:hypothetical protein
MPMLVTLAGMVIEVSDVAFANAPTPILVSWLSSAKVIEVSPVSANAYVPMLATLAGMVTEIISVRSSKA